VDKKKIFLIISAAFVSIVVYVALDIMSKSTPPWKRKGKANTTEFVKDSTQRFFGDTIYIYKVRKNDALSSIADKFNCKMDSIKSMNELKNEKVIENQSLKIKVRAIHIVQKNEFLEKIAHLYDVSTKDIMEANHISKPTQLRENQILAIPLPLAR
jgi:spore germination protein YaaH